MAANGFSRLVVLVSDMDRSKHFYREILGWKMERDLPRAASFHFGTGYLVVHIENRPPEARVYGGGLEVHVRVDDVHGEHARLRALGVTVTEPRDRPWGERTFEFKDPDNYSWTFGEVISDAT
jgi:catechol 2,3-dioxygenase-like lactoylglutathione lyase family enzyme